MSSEQTLWMYFADAGTVVKAVMVVLFLASVISWTLIIQRALLLRKAKAESDNFEKYFWSGISLSKLLAELEQRAKTYTGLAAIFYSGFKEFLKLQTKAGFTTDTSLEGAQRAMRIAQSKETERLEKHLSFLATVGSISPYIGLFGTVWGIMTAFHALGSVQQATIAMVAPGISEALIATAMGLFAAIPAVIAYNRYSSDAQRLLNRYDTFQDELSTILYRQAHGTSSHES